MRTRFDNKWQKTRGNLDVRKIVNSLIQYPTLHAYGVGFDAFRSIPEAQRSKKIDYARYMLAFELDDEIDAAARLLKALGIAVYAKDEHYVRSDYLLYLYSHWRENTEKYPKIMPEGVFAVASLVLNSRVRVAEELKPHFLVPIHTEKRKKIEEYLRFTKRYEPWPDEQIFWMTE